MPPIRDENDEEREFVVSLFATTEVVVIAGSEEEAIQLAKEEATVDLCWDVDFVQEN